ncbi:MAG: hypothetical protein HXX80_00375 [Nitrososphaerales archaeon]|nr:hypothetical protein [Nitrososphaerales archaeon]
MSVACILNIGSFHDYKNPHIVTLYRDEALWGLMEKYKRFWEKLESGTKVLIYGEYRNVKGIYSCGFIKAKEYNTEPVQEWKKNPTGYPYHITLNLSVRPNKLNNVKPITLKELSEMGVPFFKGEPKTLISIIFFDESNIDKFNELWVIFHKRNDVQEPVISVVKDELDEWVGKRFLELRKGVTSEEFQKRVNDIFRMLGFEVIEFPIGRYPDAVVYLPEPYKSFNPFWIVVDSKNISGYNLPEADKRAMEEYINSQKREALNRGLDPSKCYFLFVAPSFEKRAEEKIRSIQDNTRASGGLLLTEALLNLTLIKFKYGNKVRIDRFTELIRGAEITKDKIDSMKTFS